MGYVYFTEEQKERANTVDLKDFLERQGENGSCAPGRSCWFRMVQRHGSGRQQAEGSAGAVCARQICMKKDTKIIFSQKGSEFLPGLFAAFPHWS